MRLMVAGQKATRLRANTTAQATRKPRVVIPQVDLVNDLALSHKHMWHFLGVYFRKFKSEVMKRGSNSTNVQNLYSQTFYYKKIPKQCKSFVFILKKENHSMNTVLNLLTFYFIKPMNVSGYGSQDTFHSLTIHGSLCWLPK